MGIVSRAGTNSRPIATTEEEEAVQRSLLTTSDGEIGSWAVRPIGRLRFMLTAVQTWGSRTPQDNRRRVAARATEICPSAAPPRAKLSATQFLSSYGLQNTDLKTNRKRRNMANEEVLDRLRSIKQRGVSEWNGWREERAKERLDLKEADLSGLNLTKLDLSNSDLIGANFQNSILKRSKLRGSNLTGANLYRADFSMSDLSGTLINQCNLEETQLKSADLTDAEVNMSVLADTDLTKAKLTRTAFISSDLTNAKLNETSIEEGNFSRSKLTNSNLSLATIDGVVLNSADLRNANLRGTQFARADFTDCDLTGVKVSRETTFTQSRKTDGCLIESFTLASLKDYGGLEGSDRIRMNVIDYFGDLKRLFSGFQLWVYLISISVFLFPYAWFILSHWPIAPDFQESRESLPLLTALLRYVWSAGTTYQAWSFDSSFLIVVAIFVYILSHLLLFYKARGIEQDLIIKELPSPSALRGLWRRLQRLVKLGFWVYLLLVVLNTIAFMSRNVAVAN